MVKTALGRFATGVVVLSVRDGKPPASAAPVDPSVLSGAPLDDDEWADDPADDLAATVTAFMSVSLFPPLVAIAVDRAGYLAEVLGRRAHWGLSVLDAGQTALAGRFSAAGRPSPRLLLAEESHHRGERTGALLLDRAQGTVECVTTDQRVVGDHLLVTGAVLAVSTPTRPGAPLIRYDRAYRNLAPRS